MHLMCSAVPVRVHCPASRSRGNVERQLSVSVSVTVSYQAKQYLLPERWISMNPFTMTIYLKRIVATCFFFFLMKRDMFLQTNEKTAVICSIYPPCVTSERIKMSERK